MTKIQLQSLLASIGENDSETLEKTLKELKLDHKEFFNKNDTDAIIKHLRLNINLLSKQNAKRIDNVMDDNFDDAMEEFFPVEISIGELDHERVINNMLEDGDLSEESMKNFINGFCNMLNQPVSAEKLDEILLEIKEKYGIVDLNDIKFEHIQELLKGCDVDVDGLEKKEKHQLELLKQEDGESYAMTTTFTIDTFHLDELVENVSEHMDFEEWNRKMNPDFEQENESSKNEKSNPKREMTQHPEDLEIRAESLAGMLEPSLILDFEEFQNQKTDLETDTMESKDNITN
jgi:hypothetical protein